MELFFDWLGFAGSWLLFAGPIYQAALELQDQDIDIDRIRSAGSRIQSPPAVSNWWWLLPPVKFYKEFRHSTASRAAIFTLLSPQDVAAMISFNGKASAWLMVGVGGLFLASRDTGVLAERYGWSNLTSLLIIAGMCAISVLNLVHSLRTGKAASAAAGS